MNLKEYIAKVGDAQAAKLFGVEERTAASWRRGERTPRHKKALEIVQLTHGAISLEQIYGVAA